MTSTCNVEGKVLFVPEARLCLLELACPVSAVEKTGNFTFPLN